MFIIEIHNDVNRIVELFHIIGVWRNEDISVARKVGGHLLYLICSFGIIASLIWGAIYSNSKDDALFLGATSVTIGVLSVKNTKIRWKKEIILTFLRNNCMHSFTKENDFIRVNKKINNFMKVMKVSLSVVAVTAVFLFIVPVFMIDKALPMNIGFPLNWKNNNLNYLLAYAFFIMSTVYNIVVSLTNVLIWYIMMNCSIKYETLGNRFREMGVQRNTTSKKSEVKPSEIQDLFRQDLIELIKVHQNIQKNVNEFKAFFSDLFFVQIMTGGICICGPIYVLAFSSYETMFQLAVYFTYIIFSIFDIFMLTYLGNEIKWFSNRLSYCLFESNWIDQSKSTKKCLIILTEILQQPHELVIAKLYPLNLETFTSILHAAYSMFNILQNI